MVPSAPDPATRPDEPASTPVLLAFSPRRLARTVFISCLLLELAFVILDYHVNYRRLIDIGALRRLANIAREDGLASWFGTTQTLLVALTVWMIVVVVRAQQRASRLRETVWIITALLFTYMAIDDGAQLHERFDTTLEILGEDGDAAALEFFPSYAWQIVFVPLFAILGLTVAGFLWGELRDSSGRWLVFAALACFATAVGLDFLEGLDRDHAWNVYGAIATYSDLDTWSRARFAESAYDTLEHFSRSLEEFLEMLATTFFWVVFLRHLTTVTREIRVGWVA